MTSINRVSGRQILDSRGNPTVEIDVELACGAAGRAAVPSGASTGAHEAVELRDGNMDRFRGKGIESALSLALPEIMAALQGLDPLKQSLIDGVLIELDGTPNKSRLGANMILGASLAVAKAAANSLQIPLYRYVGGINARTLPVPMINVINGGAHADNPIDIQEFMIVPVSARSFSEAARMGAEAFHSLKDKLTAAGLSTAVGDEGGYAPDIVSAHQALKMLMEAIEGAGYAPGEDFLFALDCASTEYYRDGAYHFSGEQVTRSTTQNIEYLRELSDEFPIASVEDGCAEDDWEGWAELTDALGERCQLVGDDLFVTNRARLEEGIIGNCGNSLLVKVNQVGTLTETLEAVDLAHWSGYTTVMSHRSGETEDTTIADLAVAANCGQIKTGSMSRSERTAKYNQLIRIEEELGKSSRYPGKSAFKHLR